VFGIVFILILPVIGFVLRAAMIKRRLTFLVGAIIAGGLGIK
jgi:hypothetical protein